MKKVWKTVLITTMIMAALAIGGIFYLMGKNDSTDDLLSRIQLQQNDQNDERGYKYDTESQSIPLKTEGEGKNVLNFDSKNTYRIETSNAARARLDRLIGRGTANLENPLIARNPFGTNPDSFYFYFESREMGMVRYTIMQADENVKDFIRYVNSGEEKNMSKTHEFVVNGLTPGVKNYIKIEVLDSNGTVREDAVFYYQPPAAAYPGRLSAQTGNSKEKMENGLFFTFPSNDSHILWYDNAGCLRGAFTTEGNHGARIYQTDDSLIYQVSDTKVAKVSGLGRVTGVAQVTGYGKIRDFSYDGYGNIYSLAKKGKKEYLLATSFQTQKTKVVFQFSKGIEIESLSAPVNGNIYFAGAKPSGIIKLCAVTGKTPKISYVLGQKDNWAKTVWKKKAIENKLAQNWNTKNSIISLSEEQKVSKADSITIYLENNGRGNGVRFSIDETGKTITMEETLPIGFGGQNMYERYKKHNIIANMQNGKFTEYDTAGRVTKTFSYGKPLVGVTKLSLDPICFYGN